LVLAGKVTVDLASTSRASQTIPTCSRPYRREMSTPPTLQ